MLPAAGAVACEQAEPSGKGAEQSGAVVVDGERLTGWPLVAGEAQAGGCLRLNLVARPASPRAGAAVGADGDVHHIGFDGSDGRVGQAEALGWLGAEVLQDDIGALEELTEDGAAGRQLEVQQHESVFRG